MSNLKFNKRSRYFLAGCFALLMVFSLARKTSAKMKTAKTAASSINKRLSGKILLQVESKGEAWYVKPDDMKRYYLGRPSDAFYIMRELGLGVSEKDYWNFWDNDGKAPARLAGKILLRVEKKGEAYYVNPSNLKMYYLGRPKDAFDVMRNLGLGITNKDLGEIEIGKSIEAVIEARKHIPVKVDIDQQNRDARDAREKAQRENDEATCTYANGCEWYKGVMIRWIFDADTFPPDWAVSEEIAPSAESVTDKDDIERSIRILKKSMGKYPEYFFSDKDNRIRAIYVLKNIRTFHHGTAATLNIPARKLYITVCSDDEEEYFEQSFHHEYAHLLYWRNYDNFPEKEWDKINPPGFEYDDNRGGGFTPELAELGFLRGYSKSDRDEDFANIPPQMFKQEDRALWGNFWKIVSEYPKIRQKVNIVIDFYHKLYPIFTEEYFRKVGNE